MSDPAALLLDQLRRGLSSGDAEERRRAVLDLDDGWTPGALPLLIGAMADDDWRVRKEAAARVSAWPDVDGAVVSLVAVLGEEDDVGQRNAAVDSLVRVGARAVGPLLTALAAGGAHCKFLIDTLGAIGEASAVPGLLASLDDQDPNLRVASAEALGNLGGPEACAALVARLSSDDLLLRAAAVEGLVRMRAQVDFDRVAPCIGQVVLRAGALRLLGRCGDRRALGPIAEALRSASGRVLQAAVLAAADLLDGFTDPDDRAALLLDLRELPADARAQARSILSSPEMEDVEPRRAAAAVLGAACDLLAVPELVAALIDPRVSLACSEALASMGQAVAEPLLAAADEAASEVRAEVYEVIAGIGIQGPVVRDAMCEALRGDEPEVGAAAARALGEVGDESSVAVLIDSMASDDDYLASAAATAIGRLAERGHAPGAGTLLRGGLESDLGSVRSACALALADLGDTDAIGALAAQLTDSSPYARLAAIRALGSLGEAGLDLLRARVAAEDDAEMVAAIHDAIGEGGHTDGGDAA